MFPRAAKERDPLWVREVRGRWRRPWTFLLLGAYAGALAILARVFYGALVPQGEIPFSKQGLGLGAPLFWHFVAWQIAGWVPLGLLLGAPVLALERERRSLPELALAGIESRQIVRAKWSSLASFALVLVVAPLPVAALCFPLGGVSPMDFVAANTLCVGVALASCAMGSAVSATHKTVSSAILDATVRTWVVGFFACPLLYLAPSLAPELLLAGGVVAAMLPLYLLRRVEEEIYFLTRHLEIDAPQTPDWSPDPDTVPLRLEPQLLRMSAGAKQAREPMSAQELARTMNAAQVERGLLEPPPSKLDLQLEALASRNVLAERDVRTQLRAWRRVLLIGEPAPVFSIRAALLVGAALALLGVITSGVATTLHVCFDLLIGAATVQTALLSSGGWARERAGNMMAQLQLTALSPPQIVGAKVVTPILLGARFWGIPLVGLGLAALPASPLRIAEEACIGAGLLLLSSLLGAVCGLRFRAVTLATPATLGALVVLFLVLPAVFSPMLFAAPAPIEVVWLVPIRALVVGGTDAAPVSPMLLSLAGVCAALWGWALRAWRRCLESG